MCMHWMLYAWMVGIGLVFLGGGILLSLTEPVYIGRHERHAEDLESPTIVVCRSEPWPISFLGTSASPRSAVAWAPAWPSDRRF